MPSSFGLLLSRPWLGAHVRANLSLSDTKPSQVLPKVGQVLVIWIARLQVDVIPGDTVVLAGGDAPPHREEQPLLPREVEPVQGLEPLIIIR